MRFFRRAWAEIDLDALAGNLARIRQQVPGRKIMAVVKADAYGHGAPAAAAALAEAGADWLSVSNLEEALQIREQGVRLPMLILGYTPSVYAALLAEQALTQTLFCTEYAHALSAAAEAAGVRVEVHIKMDTGMSRLGFDGQSKPRTQAVIAQLEAACRLPGLHVDGLYTHFAAADYDGDPDGSFTRQQADLLLETAGLLEQRGISLAYKHCCNSAGIITQPELGMDMVRPGLLLYGINPVPSTIVPIGNFPTGNLPGATAPLELVPAMQMKTVISMIKTVRAGDTLSYGRTFTADRDMRVATLPIGYADGYARRLSGRAYMLVNGCKAPVVGRVCMDQLLLDVSEVPGAVAGGTVTVFGRDGDACLSVEELAALSDTIPYETLCLIGKRVPRIYYQEGKIVDQLNYLTKR